MPVPALFVFGLNFGWVPVGDGIPMGWKSVAFSRAELVRIRLAEDLNSPSRAELTRDGEEPGNRRRVEFPRPAKPQKQNGLAQCP